MLPNQTVVVYSGWEHERRVENLAPPAYSKKGGGGWYKSSTNQHLIINPMKYTKHAQRNRRRVCATTSASSAGRTAAAGEELSISENRQPTGCGFAKHTSGNIQHAALLSYSPRLSIRLWFCVCWYMGHTRRERLPGRIKITQNAQRRKERRNST